MDQIPYREISEISQLPAPDATGIISRYVFQYIDFNQVPQYVAAGHLFSDCCFLGCDIPSEMEGRIGQTCLIFPRMGRTYNVFRTKLYDGETLYAGYDPENEESYSTCFDARVYADYIEKGQQCDDIRETLGRTLHDRAMSSAMREFLSRFDERQVVAIMGGHALQRSEEGYRKVALISKKLTEKGKLMASGGGPGAMEATHLGAWMAGRSEAEFDEAMQILSTAQTFRDEGWLRALLAEKGALHALRDRHRQVLLQQSPRGYAPGHCQGRDHLLPRLGRHHSGNLPGRRPEPLRDLRRPQPDGVPGQGILHPGNPHLPAAGRPPRAGQIPQSADIGYRRSQRGHRHRPVLPVVLPTAGCGCQGR